MDYNTSRKKLILPEYGRNIQKMVDHLVAVENKTDRTRMAYGIINIMAIMHNNNKDSHDFKRKLWDHLHIMSNFSLNIDSPYPAPESTTLKHKPNKIGYLKDKIKFKHYGRVIENLLTKLTEYEEGDEKQELTKVIANLMKKSYITWNRDVVNDKTIFDDIYLLTKGEITVDNNLRLTNSREFTKGRKQKRNPKKHDSKRSNYKSKYRRHK